YSGGGVRRTQAAAPPDPKASTTTTISSGLIKPGKLNSTAQRLVTCIAHAQGDVNKIAVCQRKFVP
ncbi:MAG TPA: hypothetical protein VGF91_05495, partial [Solirubrobacteraceae bacterium]